jgi:hypothetical protein
MSDKNLLKYKYYNNITKTKKRKIKFIFDLTKGDESPNKKYNSHSCEKLNTRNQNMNINLKNNIKTLNKIFEIKNIDDLEILPLTNINYLYSAWKSSNLIDKNFETKILNDNDFEINYNTFEITTKNEKADKQLEDELFWELFIDHLILNNHIKNGKQFLKAINLAFSKLKFNYKFLLIYYLEKIKKFNPIIKDGNILYNDDIYIQLLDGPVKSRIEEDKRNLITDIKIGKNRNQNNLDTTHEFTPVSKKSKKE